MTDTKANIAKIEKARSGVQQADTKALEDVRKSDPATAEAVEQEAEDGPPGRGLSR